MTKLTDRIWNLYQVALLNAGQCEAQLEFLQSLFTNFTAETTEITRVTILIKLAETKNNLEWYKKLIETFESNKNEIPEEFN